MQDLFRKSVAAVTVASLILTAPGVGVYAAIAAEFEGKAAERPSMPGIQIAPAVPLGALNAPLNPASLPNTALPSAADAPRAAAVSGDAAAGRVSPSAAAGRGPAAASSQPAAADRRAAAPEAPAASVAPELPRSLMAQLAPSAGAPARRAAAAGRSEAGVSAPAAAAAQLGSSDGGRLFDGAGRWLRRALGRETVAAPAAAAAPVLSPAERAAQRLAARSTAEAPRNAALFAEVLGQTAKGGQPVRTVYAFFEPTGRLLRVDQSPRGSGVSLELKVGADASLSLARNADGALSQHNRMSRGQFKSRRMDAFMQAQATLAETEPLLRQALGLAAPQIVPAPAAVSPAIVPAPAAAAPAKAAAKPRTGPVTIWHELLSAGAVAYTTYLASTMALAYMPPLAAAAVGVMVMYGAAKIVLNALDSKRRAHDLEAAALSLTSEKAAAEPAAVEEKVAEPAAVEEKAAEPAAVEEKAAEPAAVEKAAQPAVSGPSELERAEKALQAARKPRPVGKAQELLAVSLIAAAAYGGFVALSWTGLGIGVAVALIVAELYLKHTRDAFKSDSANIRSLVSARDAAAASEKAQQERQAAAAKPAEPAAAAAAAPATAPVEAKKDETPAAQAAKIETPAAKAEQPSVESAAAGAAASTVPPTPAGWKSLPAEAREWTPQRLVAAKKAAQKRARALAPDAQLVGAAINLDDPTAHYAFTFYSKAKGLGFTVRPKSITAKKWPKGKAAVALWESRLAALEGLEAAYARLKAEKNWFKPGRVELVPARAGDASWKFIDAKGREVFVGGTAAAKPPVAFISAAGVTGETKSFSSLPADAQMPLADFLKMKAAAQARARAESADARLIGASIRLDDERAHWNFDFESRGDKKVHTVYPKRIDSEKLGSVQPPLWDTRLAASSFKNAYTALKRAQPGFKPARAQLTGVWNGDPVWVFTNAAGKVLKVSAAEAAASEPAPTQPGDRAPPAPPDQTQIPPAPPGPPGGQAQSPPEAPPPPATSPAPEKETPPAPNGPHIHEGFFGFRRVQGLTHQEPGQAPLKALPLYPEKSQVIDQIARQFGIARPKLLALAAPAGITEDSATATWLSAYDALRRMNREQFKRFDHKKYDGWSSFRSLANRSYPAGWKGALLRASEVHKHFMGFFVRFPYHLFDMFVLGYFRQNISYEYFHAQEDFINLVEPGVASKYAAAAFKEAAAKSGSRWKSKLVGLRSVAAVRGLDRYLWTPLLDPLSQFMRRRFTMAVFSAVAMGLVAAAAPGLTLFGVPILAFKLTAIPYLGQGLVLLANGLPAAVGGVPFIGHFLAPVVAAATGTLLKDLIVGPLLNTLLLSTFLTFPHAVRERLAVLTEKDPSKRIAILSLSTARLVLATAFTWTFWRANWKSFFGMITVGAEIDGIMTYAGKLDGLAEPAWNGVTGKHFTLFHDLGSAVEKPKGESVIPFGGAITWGNVLLYKLQEHFHFNISDKVALALNPSLAKYKSADGKTLGAANVVSAYSHAGGPAGHDLDFDKDLYQKSPDQIAARLKELAAKAGDLDGEIAAVKQHRLSLETQLTGAHDRVAELERRSKPVTPAERAQYEALRQQLASVRDEDYDQGKLAESHDLKNPKDDAARLKQLRDMLAQYQGSLVDREGEKPATKEDLSVTQASLTALQRHLESMVKGQPLDRGAGSAPRVSQEEIQKITALVAQIEKLRVEAKAEMTNRDAEKQLLAVANQSRNRALRDRRDGKDMLEFHKNLSRLDTVMALALSLNEIAAAEAAIKDMLAMLDAKIAAINASAAQNQQNLAQAQQNQQNVQGWKDQANKDIAGDKDTQKTIVDDETKAGMAVQRITSFQQDMSALITMINARDGGQSGSADKEYQRRIDLLPTVAKWRQDGNPSNPDAFSIKKFNDDLAQVNDYIKQAQDGLTQLSGVPVEFAGAVVLLVPGPKVNVSNPTKAQALQILADRKVYWKGQAATYQKSLDSINRMLDPNNTNTTVDEFGDSAPESLPRYRAQASANEQRAMAAVQQYTAQIDAAAAQVNSVAGSHLPPLSGLSLDQLKDAITKYGDQVRAVSIPDADASLAAHTASMNLISIAKLLPYTADNVIVWAKADGTMKAIDDAMSTTLPVAKSRLTAVSNMFNDVLTDVDADIAYVSNGGDNQALLDRKTALLRDKILPPLQGAQDLIQNTLIPYQQNSIKTVQTGTGDLWTLFDSQRTLMTTTEKLYNTDVSWALATYGGSKTDPAGSHAKIATWRQGIQKNIDGYDDATGHHKGVNEYATEVQHRKDPNYMGTEVLYGETQPFSLPRKIAQYSAERAQRAPQINTQAAQLNSILTKIETLSKGKYNLAAYRLPTDISDDPSGVARVQAIVDAKTIPNLADVLKQIGNDNNTGSTSINLGSQGNAGPPSGTQPPITISDQQTLALLALDAAKRLVPTSLQQPDSAPAAYAIARFLYSDSVVSAAKDGLDNQVPAAESFLAHALAGLNGAVASTQKDDAYVDSNGTSETAAQLYARKIATFSSLDSFLREGMTFFNLKIGWDQSSLNSVDKIATYYNSLNTIYSGGSTANTNELTAANQMRAALTQKMTDLEATRTKVSGWMTQLNDPHESALRRVNESMSTIQDKTRAVLESNVKWHDVEDQLARTNDILKSEITQINALQTELQNELDAKKNEIRDGLPPDLVNRIEALRLGHGSFGIGGPGGADGIVVKKSEFGAFLDTVLKMFSSEKSSQDLSMIKADLLANPQGLAALIPDAQMLDFGNTADGFYLVYQTKFSVPHGLETGSQITLGNVAKVWGNNVSVTGYQFASPPNAENAPYGDKGIEVQIESLQGKNWVNYLNIDMHRFAFDIPPDGSAIAEARQNRMMVFDDFAMMLFGDRLYIGMAGFGDMALDQPGQHPTYYGGNFKTSLKLNEVMRLNAEQQELFAKDPRSFLQQVNLDFTGYDPTLNKDYNIRADGAQKEYHRTQIGPQVDVGRLMHSDNAFTVDLFWSKTSGTDDINQQTLGATILKGFSIKDENGKPWMNINNKATGELGQQYNTFSDRLSVELPNQGIVVSGQGKLLGTAQAYYGEIAKKMGDNANLSLGYGSQYVGMNNRLSITMNTQFTLGELWQAVVDHNRVDLKGGEQLQKYNKQLDDFFKADSESSEPSQQVTELKRVFEQDVARKLITQDVGTLRREIDELRKAGAFMDNTRVRGMVGFVSAPVSNDEAERAIGGGVVVGSETQLTLSKTQKALIEAKSQTLFREGVRLQQRMMELTKQWQSAVAEIAQAQWDMKVAEFMKQNAGSNALRQQAEVQAAEAEARMHQATLRYNALSGRSPTDPVPFDNLNAADLQQLMFQIRKTVAQPDRLNEILHSLDRDEMKRQLGDNPFNLIDWLPFIDKFTIGVGAQLQDLMANQVFTLGVTVRIPVYDPHSKAADHAYSLESQATIAEMSQIQSERRLAAETEAAQARLWKLSADAARPGLPQAAQQLSMSIRAYRNGLIGPAELQKAFDAWRWYASSVLDADTRSALAGAWAASDSEFSAAPTDDGSTVRITALDQAFPLVAGRSQSLAEIALRQKAAAEMAQANDHRIQKAWVDLSIGTGLTASGVGWLPSIGLTGFPVMPILGFEFKPEELRELQVEQGKGQTEYYKQLRAKLEAGLALEFYQNIIEHEQAQKAVALFDGSLLPKLRQDAQAAKATGTAGDAMEAQRRLDAAIMRRDQAALGAKTAKATLNYLLGRPADAKLDIAVDPQQALASLKTILAEKQPVETQRRLLDSRVKVAQDVETMVDKDLKVEQLALEPVSMTVRSLGRLIEALGSDEIGNPDLTAAARIQTLAEQRARDSYEKRLTADIARTASALALTRGKILSLQAVLRSDPSDADAQIGLEMKRAEELDLIATLVSLGVDPEAGSGGAHNPVPDSYARLRDGLQQAQQGMAAAAPEAPVEMMAPEELKHQAAGFLRYYYAKQTLGKEPIDQGFMESWIEVRLRYYETDPDALLALSKLRTQKQDRIYQTQLAGARARGDVLAADFEMNVQMRRWADRADSNDSLRKFKATLDEKLRAQRDEIVALLNLSPDTTLAQLKALVPAETSAGDDLASLSRGFTDEIRARQLDQIKKMLFEDGVPDQLGGADDLIHQLRADTIAERMSYKGFTPVAAFGIFRDKPLGGAFIEAPDPREIQRGLDNVLSDVLRKDLEASGRMKDLTLHLHSLMARVEDGAHEIEKRRALVEAAEADYRSQMGRFKPGTESAEIEAARQRLVDAWLGFSDQMVRTKADFIALVAELEALNLGRGTGLMPLAQPLSHDLPELRRDPRANLIAYWSDRMLDDPFRGRLASRLDEIAAASSPAKRAALEKVRRAVDRSADLYQLADRDFRAVTSRDFTASEELELLTRNDKEGKREALATELALLFDVTGGATDKDGLGQFLVQDVEAQAKTDAGRRRDYMDLSRAVRGGGWDALDASVEARAVYGRLEYLRGRMEDAKQSLLDSYLTDMGDNPEQFILKDLQLDGYLKAQQNYDDEVVAAFSSKAVAQDRALAWRLDGFFDLKTTLDRQIDATRAGRGMLALDALLMLEDARLQAARWQGRPPHEIDQIALALETLRMKKDAWQQGESDLVPLYGVTEISKDGQRVWSVKNWLTEAELKDIPADQLKETDGRIFWTGKDGVVKEIIGGVDAAESKHDAARGAAGANRVLVDNQEAMAKYDFVLDAPLENGTAGYTVDDLFARTGDGPQLAAHGRLFFFEAPGDGSADLHRALHPLDALKLSPDRYVMYVYEGKEAIARDRYPTLESLKASDQAGKFSRLTISEKGAQDLGQRAADQRDSELRTGWIDVKLNSYGFARDEHGQVSELFTTQDDFDAHVKTYKNAARDLVDLKEAQAQADARVAALEKTAAARGEEARRASLEYQNAQAAARAAVDAQMKKDIAEHRAPGLEKGPKESQQLYNARYKLEADKRLQLNDAFKAAQKKFDPIARKSSEAAEELKAAQAEAINAKKAVQDGEVTLARSKTWSLYRSKDLTLSLDKTGAVVAAAAQPSYGAAGLSERIAGGPAVHAIEGEMIAAALDEKGRVVSYYQDPKQVAADAPSWQLKTVALTPSDPDQDKSVIAAGSKSVDPRYRLAHYELKDPKTGAWVPVSLSRRYMIDRAEDAKSKLTGAEYWGVMPWRWGSLIMELPRGVVSGPVELVTGRDPRQHHYLGRVYMYKTEGGETEHHGFFRKVADVIDVLDFMPDKVERFYDPSQFPDQVIIDSPVKPGENLYDKSLRTEDGKKDVHFGAKSLKRSLDESIEDLTTARARTLARFHGGVQETVISTKRGRRSTYTESHLRGTSGPSSVGNAFTGDQVVANDPNSDGSGEIVTSGRPENILVDQVEKRVTVIVGADDLNRQVEALKGYPELLKGRLKAQRDAQADLDRAALKAQTGYNDALDTQDDAHARAGSAWERVRAWSQRIGEQEALERDLSRWRAIEASLRAQLAWWQDYLNRLLSLRRGEPDPGPRPGPADPVPGPGNPSGPGVPPVTSTPAPANPGAFWAWALAAFGVLAAAAAAGHLLWRRRPRIIRPSR